jgi:hypothetical protein
MAALCLAALAGLSRKSRAYARLVGPLHNGCHVFG